MILCRLTCGNVTYICRRCRHLQTSRTLWPPGRVVWSLYAPDYLARLFQIQGPFDEATYAAYATPQPGGPGRGARIALIDAIWKVRDGLYAVEAVKRYPSVPMPKRLIFWIEAADGHYQIAEITGEISFSVP